MEIAVSGGSGFISSALIPVLTEAGHRVVRLVRSQPPSASPDIYWDPDKSVIDAAKLEGKQAVVHLAGETIAERWTARKKALIRDSRIQGTRLLSEALAKLASPPQLLVSASAIGFYGDRGEEILREESAPGEGFLAEVCRDWEAATEAASRARIRVVHLRIGIVLSPRGGALAKMLPPFRMGAGGRLGSGRQYMSWIALDDLAGGILHVIQTPSLHGSVNMTAPNPVTNLVFTKTLGKVLTRPTMAPMPTFAVRLLFGEMGESLLLGSQRVLPARLTASGFTFRYPDLEPALRHLLGE